MERKRLFSDVDGVLAHYPTWSFNEIGFMYVKDYFRSLKPHLNVLDALKRLVTLGSYIEKQYTSALKLYGQNDCFTMSLGDILEQIPEVYVATAYLSDSEYALEEKRIWLDTFLPQLPENHRIFIPCGQPKGNYIPGGVRPDDYLLDDYTTNLLQWTEMGGKGIKLLNGLNDTHGTWTGSKLSNTRTDEELAAKIMEIMNNDIVICDEQPPSQKTGKEKSDIFVRNFV